MNQKFNSSKIATFLLTVIVGISFSCLILKAENQKLINQSTFVIPIASETFRQIKIPFHQIFSGESSYQIKVMKELPSEYGLKVGLAGKYIQKDWEVGPIPSGSEDTLCLRIYSPLKILPTEQYAKILIGSSEDSSISATINIFLQPVEKKEIQLIINKTTASVNGKTISMDTSPLIIKGRTFVPFRFIGTELGAKITYTMSPKTKLVDTVTFQLGKKSIKLTIGSSLVEILNDKEKIEKQLESPPLILKGRTLIPLRFVSEELGSSITWEGNTQAIGIFFPQSDSKPTDNGNIFYKPLTSKELHDSIEKQEKQYLIDIRIETEYKKGHIPTAINIYETEINEEGLSKAGIQKSDKIIIYCNSGLRNIGFCELLTNLGYTNVYALTKGLSGWTYDKEK